MSIWNSNQMHKDEKAKFSIRPYSYTNYFEGHIIRQIPSPDGSIKNVRVYVGDYYVVSGGRAAWLKHKLMILALFTIGFAFFLLAVTANTLGNRFGYFLFPAVLAMCGYFYLAYVLIGVLTAPQRMTIGIYRSIAKPLVRSSVLTSLLTLVCLVCRVVAVVRLGSADLPGGLLCSGALLLSVACTVIIWRYEKHTGYETEKNENAAG